MEKLHTKTSSLKREREQQYWIINCNPTECLPPSTLHTHNFIAEALLIRVNESHFCWVWFWLPVHLVSMAIFPFEPSIPSGWESIATEKKSSPVCVLVIPGVFVVCREILWFSIPGITKKNTRKKQKQHSLIHHRYIDWIVQLPTMWVGRKGKNWWKCGTMWTGKKRQLIMCLKGHWTIA